MLNFRNVLRLIEEENWDGLLQKIPELGRLDGLWQGIKYHYTDAWTHTKHVIKAVKLLKIKLENGHVNLDFDPPPESGFYGLQNRPIFDEFVSRWIVDIMNREMESGIKLWDVVLVAALFHDIGKPDTAEDVGDGIRVHFIGHPEVGAKYLENALGSDVLKEPWASVLHLVKSHFVLLAGFSYNSPQRRYIPDVSESIDFRAMLLILSMADIIASRSNYRFDEYVEYLGAVAWFWIFYEDVLCAKSDYFSATYAPTKYRAIKKAASIMTSAPPNPYAEIFKSISVKHHGDTLSLSKEFMFLAEFSIRHPVDEISRQGVKFLVGLINQLPFLRNSFSSMSRNNHLLSTALSAADIILKHGDSKRCDECNALAASVLCDMGDKERARSLINQVEAPQLFTTVSKFCYSREIIEKLRRVSAYGAGISLGYTMPKRVKYWLTLPCASVAFYSWDELFEKLTYELLNSPPSKAGKANGELQRLYLKLWECPGIYQQLSEYSRWLSSVLMGSYYIKESDELLRMIIASINDHLEEELKRAVAESSSRTLATALNVDTTVVLYIKTQQKFKDILAYDIGRKTRNLIKTILKSQNPCKKLTALGALVGVSVEKVTSPDDLLSLLSGILVKSGMKMALGSEKFEGLVKLLPAPLSAAATECLNSVRPRRGPHSNLISYLKRFTKLLINPFL